MKNKLSYFIDKVNRAVDSLTNALENSGSGNKQQSNVGSIIDRLPVGESKKTQQSIPAKQIVEQKPTPAVAENVKNPEHTTMVEPIIYSMYVCPECRKVFKVKGNDKTVKCSHCEGIHLKDINVAETVWRTYGKNERDKVISDLLDEEEFEEVFEEVIEENLSESSKFFDENGQFIDFSATEESINSNKKNDHSSRKSNNSNGFFEDDETGFSSESFFSGYDNFNNMGSMPPKKVSTYGKPSYMMESNKRKNYGGRPFPALIVLIMVGVVYFAGSSLLSKNSDQNVNTTDKVTTKAYSSESATKPLENKPEKSKSNTTKYDPKQSKYKNNYTSEKKVTTTKSTQSQTNTNKKSTNNSRQTEDRVVVPKTEDTQGYMVWIPTNGGKRYHSKSSCSGMKNPEQVTLEEAKDRGFTPCQRCY